MYWLGLAEVKKSLSDCVCTALHSRAADEFSETIGLFFGRVIFSSVPPSPTNLGNNPVFLAKVFNPVFDYFI